MQMKKSGDKDQLSAGNESSSRQGIPKLKNSAIESSVDQSNHQNSKEENSYLSKDKKRV